LKYRNEKYPTNRNHDVLYIMGINRNDVSKDDIIELERLGFDYDDDEDAFYSFRFGSA